MKKAFKQNEPNGVASAFATCALLHKKICG